MRKVLEGRSLYDDGNATRPSYCKTEIAFADSIGGAVYGALQNTTHELIDRGHGPPVHDWFGDDTQIDEYVIYGTGREPDYEPTPSFMDQALKVVDDFWMTGEVRYCNEPVPVKVVCTVPITRHDYAVASSIIYHLYDKCHFDFDEILSDEEAMVAFERVLAGDADFVAKYKLQCPLLKDFGDTDYPEGINPDVVLPFMRILEGRCKMV